MIIYPGLTNISNPLSEADIRQYFTPVFERFRQHKDLGTGMKIIYPKSLLPKFIPEPPGCSYGYHLAITNMSVTSTNVTLTLKGKEAEYPDADRNNNLALFTFGKDLNLVETRIITNEVKTVQEIHTNTAPQTRLLPLRRGQTNRSK